VHQHPTDVPCIDTRRAPVCVAAQTQRACRRAHTPCLCRCAHNNSNNKQQTTTTNNNTQANVKEGRFGLDYIQGFDLVLNGLDNMDARRHVNRCDV
jgi:hypothetical protein